MCYKPIDDRQVINRAALTNIGSPADDNLADIFSRIDAILAGISGGSGYYAQQQALTSGSTSIVVNIPTQHDTSYIVLAMMGNVTDSLPQFQQVQVTVKNASGFTFSWNHPLDTGNYYISYIIPFKVFPEAEAIISSGADILSAVLPIPQGNSSYPIIAQIQNLIDSNPQFQAVVVGSNTTTNGNFKWNVDTDSANYQMVYGILASGQTAISMGVTSVTVPLPVNFNSTHYSLIAVMQNTVNSFPQYQPLLITNQSDVSATVSWNIPTDVSSYVINYYAITLTP